MTTQPTEEFANFGQDQIEAAKACISAAATMIANGENEQRIRDNFTSRLRLMFPTIPKWVEEHIVGGEAALRTLTAGKATTGFVDNLVGLTLIEYEANLKNAAKFKEGYGQVQKYCASKLNEGFEMSRVTGVLSDTLVWLAYQVKGTTPGAPMGRLEAHHVELELVEQVDVSGGSDGDAARLLDFLVRYLQRLGSRPLNAYSIAMDLGFGSEYCARHLPGVTGVVTQAFDEKPDYGAVIAKLWCDFVSYVTSKGKTANFNQSEYINELYILTLGKLICANLLTKKAIVSDDSELSDILRGDFFKSRGLLNFVEYDYFGWLNSLDKYRAQLIPVARAMQDDLRAYNFSTLPGEDLFGRLMAQLAGRSQVLLLGQEWTPTWLANGVVKRVISFLPEGEDPRLLDMCCGSGSMIVEAVGQTKELLGKTSSSLSNSERLRRLESAITGFDVDPLAVMLAKINWVIAARDWLPSDGAETISIPIYQADSLFAMTPLSKAIDKADKNIELQVMEHKLQLPKFLVSSGWQRVFDNVLDRAYALATTKSKLTLSIAQARDIAVAACDEVGVHADGEELDACAEFLKDLAEKVNLLDLQGRNGIWAFVLRNSYRPALVAGQFNGIVSNPPWLALSKIGSNPYKDSLERMAGDLGIKPTGPSFLHLEMATTFLLHAVDRYLSPGAAVGCVLPETVLNGHQHTQFREGSYSHAARPVQFTVDEIWKVAKGTFKNLAIVAFGRKSGDPNPNPIPGVVAYPDGSVDATEFYPVAMGPLLVWSENAQASPANLFKPANFQQGADIMPRTFFFHDANEVPNRAAFSLAPIGAGSPLRFLVNDAKEQKDFVVGAGCAVPSALVYEVLISKHLAPFLVARAAKAFLPISRDAVAKWKAVSLADVLAMPNSQRAHAELSRIATRYSGKADLSPLWLDSVKGKGLNYRNKLTNQSGIRNEKYLVFTGAGGSFLCSAILPLHHVPDSSKLIIDQTLYWAPVPTFSEALYLCGMLNSEPANELIKAFQPKGQQGERHIHELGFGITPPFDRTKPEHREVVIATISLLKEYYSRLQTAAASANKPSTPKAASANKRDIQLAEAQSPAKDLRVRRRILRELLCELPSYTRYNDACRAVYGV